MADVLPLFEAPRISRLIRLNAQRVALSLRLKSLKPNTHKAIALRSRLADLTVEALALEIELGSAASDIPSPETKIIDRGRKRQKW